MPTSRASDDELQRKAWAAYEKEYAEYLKRLEASIVREMEKGDLPGHPFRGNQYVLTSTKPPKVFGMRRATYQDKTKAGVMVLHSDYSSSMRTGSTLGGYSDVSILKPGGLIDLSDPGKKFTGPGHEEKSVRYLRRKYGIEHDPKKLQRYGRKSASTHVRKADLDLVLEVEKVLDTEGSSLVGEGWPRKRKKIVERHR